MVHTTEKIAHRSLQTKRKLDRLLDKVELDRNFKLKEKMELLWADSDSSLSQEETDEPTLSLKQKVEQKRINRLRCNKQQADAYSTTLQKCTQNRNGDL